MEVKVTVTRQCCATGRGLKVDFMSGESGLFALVMSSRCRNTKMLFSAEMRYKWYISKYISA